MELQSTFNKSDLYPYVFKESSQSVNKADSWLDELPNLPKPRSKEPNLSIAEYLLTNRIWEKLIKEKIDKSKPLNKSICPNLEYFSSIIQFKLIKAGESLFHVNDKGDNFYILFKGQFGVIKVKDQTITKQWSCQQIVDYLSYLVEHSELYVFNQVIKLNSQEIPFDSLADFLKFQSIYLKTRLQLFIINMQTLDIDLVNKFMKNHQSLNSMKIKEAELERHWNTRMIYPDEWGNYINKLILITGEERVFMQRFLMLTQSDFVVFHLIAYEHFMYISQGNYFGDFALDTPDKKRNATTISLTNSIVGLVNEDYYQTYISPRRKKFKKNEMAFLHDNFFFKEIGSQTFEQRLFHFFYLQEMQSGHYLFVRNQAVNEYYILRDGNVQLTITLSLIQMRELIKEISDRLLKYCNFLEKDIQTKLLTLNKIYSQPLSFKQKLSWYQNQMSIKRTFELFIYNKKEVIGFETHFLGFKEFFTNAKILSQEAQIYSIAASKLNPMIEEDIYSLNLFKSHGSLKAYNFIDRLDKITSKMISMTNQKANELEYDNSLKRSSLFYPFPLGTKEMIKMSITSKISETKNKVFNNKHLCHLGIRGSIIPPLLSLSNSEAKIIKSKKMHFGSSLRKSSSFVESKVIVNSKELRSSLLSKQISKYTFLSPIGKFDDSNILNSSDLDCQTKGFSINESYYNDQKKNEAYYSHVLHNKMKDCTISIVNINSDETNAKNEKTTMQPKIKMLKDLKREKRKSGAKLEVIKKKIFNDMIKVFDETAKSRIHKEQKTIFVFNHFCNTKRDLSKSQ